MDSVMLPDDITDSTNICLSKLATGSVECCKNVLKCLKSILTIEELKVHAENAMKEYLSLIIVDGFQPLIMTSLRKLLSDPIDINFHLKLSQDDFEHILELGVKLDVPKVVSNVILGYQETDLRNISNEVASYLTDAFWILTNISSGNSSQTLSVIKAGSIPFVKEIIVNCQNMELVTQCVMLISNVICEDTNILDEVLNGSVYETVRRLFYRVSDECKGQILHLYFSIVKCKQRLINDEKANAMIHQAATELKYGAPTMILRPIMDLFNERTKQGHTTNRVFSLFIDSGYVAKLTPFLSHSDITVKNRCLMSLGNLILGDDNSTWKVLKSGLLQHLIPLLFYDNLDIIKHCLWILSNIAAGESEMIEYFYEFDLLPIILDYILCGEAKVAIEALWTLNNIVKDSTIEQLKKNILLNKDILFVIERVLASDSKLMQPSVTSSYQYLKCILETLQDILGFLQDSGATHDKGEITIRENMIELLKSTRIEKNLLEKKLIYDEIDDHEMTNNLTMVYELYEEYVMDVTKSPSGSESE